MSTPLKKLKLQDLKIGMHVESKEELSDIFDTWIILYKLPCESIWTVGFIGTNLDDNANLIYRNKGNDICPVFNDSIELDGDIYYDE